MSSSEPEPDVVFGLPRVLLRIEGVALLGMTVILYRELQRSWILFVVLLLLPDVGILGYLRGNVVGAFAYDLVHTYLAPGTLGMAGVIVGNESAIGLSLIWFAHIGMDRALGYGLKYTSGFHHTHLGVIGKRSEGRDR